MGKLTHKTALITGGSEGIGFAIASTFADEGADLVLLARDPLKLAAAQQALAAKGVSVRTVAVDLSETEALTTALRGLDTPVDVLVNNVGLAHLKPLPDITLAEFDAMVHLNLRVPFLMSQQLLPKLTATRGNIINISSYWAEKMVAGRPSSAYSATRGALNAMTRALANELGPAHIRVNAIAPGSIQTPTFERDYLSPMTPERRAEYDRYVQGAYPAGHIGRPEDVAAAALYLASEDARWITGVILKVDGGLTVR